MFILLMFTVWEKDLGNFVFFSCFSIAWSSVTDAVPFIVGILYFYAGSDDYLLVDVIGVSQGLFGLRLYTKQECCNVVIWSMSRKMLFEKDLSRGIIQRMETAREACMERSSNNDFYI